MFFLLLSTIFWVLTKFSRKDVSEIEANIAYVNVPSNKILAEDNLKSLTFELQANRFEALYYNVKTPIISVDVAAYLNGSKNKSIVDKASLTGLISNQVNKNLTVRNVSVNQLEIKLVNVDSKKVPVIASTSLTFKNGFDEVGDAIIKPDSILLRGPRKLLDSISEISTIEFKRAEIEKSLKVKIPLIGIPSRDIQMVDTEVIYSLKVEEFSQKIVTLPVKLINAPATETIKLIPNKVEIDFTVSLSLFNDISANDFEVICDYAKRNADENFMIPEIVKFPEGIKDAVLTTKKIDFLIFK